MSTRKNKRSFYYPICAYYKDGKYRGSLPLFQRARDSSFFIIEDGRRVSVAIVNARGTVIKIPKDTQ